MKKTYLLTILSLFASFSFSQIKKVTPLTNLTVIEHGDTLQNPLSGGISAPEYSTMDLNNDGIKDLVLFERDGPKVTCFLNAGIPNTIKYTYAPEYTSKFPAGLYDWMLLRDYNGDGKQDIFTQGPFGIRMFKNTSTGSDITFTLATNELQADYGSGFYSNIDITASDVPEIIDVDSDGDLDLFVFKPTGTSAGDELYFFKNFAIELAGSADTLTKYAVYKRCYGKFVEDYSGCTVELNSMAAECGTNQRPDLTNEQNQIIAQRNSSNGKHAGSSLLMFDANGDNLYDVLVGDVSCNTLYLLTNSNDNTEALISNVTYNYPPSHPVNIFVFPVPFYIDVNNDNKRDLLIATNGYRGTVNSNTTWLYLNTGTDAVPVFTFETQSFLQDQMIDVRQNASPYFFDYNNDGKTDLAIANAGSWQQNLATPVIDSASITMYKNIGTNAAPVYELVTSDYDSISQYHFINLSMTTSDLDEDGDADLMLGEEDGMLYYFNNTAAAGAPAHFQLHTPSYQNIDIGKYSIPFFTDINQDTKADLLLGGKGTGDNLYLYTDTSASAILPEFKLTNNKVGGIKQSTPFSTGASMYFNKNYDGNGTNSLFITKGSTIYFYDSIPADLNGTFKKSDSIYLNIGSFIRITMQDLNGDGKKELIAGTSAGGLTAYEIEYETQVGINPVKATEHTFRIYPNPAKEQIQIESIDNKQMIRRIEMYDILGRSVLQENNINTTSYRIQSNTLKNGSYILKIHSGENIATQIILVNH